MSHARPVRRRTPAVICDNPGMKHEVTRLQFEVRRRVLTVRRSERLTPHMQRVVLGGEALDGFTSPAPDDHVKIFLPTPDGIVGREYTPRLFDALANELTLDFALHDAGPATDWARQSQPGQTIEIAGPRASSLIPADFDWWLLIGDETALPAIARRIEMLPAGTPVTSIVTVAEPADEQPFVTTAMHRAVWLHRPGDAADAGDGLLATLEREPWPAGDGFIWIGAEASVARVLRQHAVDVRQHPPAWIKASSYWTRGLAAKARPRADG